jgi:zinc/manganese transport system permease protein
LPVQNYLVSLAFTMLGALLFVFFRGSHERIPVEALIGITYAGAMALSLIVLERSASGTEEIKEMLAGSILTVSNRELLFIAALYFCVGLIHWIARRPLLLVTENPGEAKRRGMRLWLWDLVFYATFGFVVTSSVKVAGVLLVFAFLIIPAVAATVAVRGAAWRIVFGWIFGVIGCIGGLELSLRLDWSPAPTIIATFLVLLVGTWGVRGRAGVE